MKYRWRDLEERQTLTVERIGIEPAYRRQGHARFLKKKAEEIALEFGLDTVVAEMIENPIMKELNVKLGYTLYDRGHRAVKRLIVPIK
ncbi:GNAT family N-acetyltransferase [Candidatus Woesearchaeota archaeon]|nr:GNAT family N-acetyltransferase [Candidatus Woesearchaeota archaeon]